MVNWVANWLLKISFCKRAIPFDRHSASYCNMLQHAATHCNTKKIRTTNYTILQYTARLCIVQQHPSTQHVFLSTLHVGGQACHVGCEACHIGWPLCCTTLQHNMSSCRPCIRGISLARPIALYCNTLQHTESYCNAKCLPADPAGVPIPSCDTLHWGWLWLVGSLKL